MWGFPQRPPDGLAPSLTRVHGPGKFQKVVPGHAREGGAWVRLIFENSTVCHSRRISLFCPVIALFVGVVVVSLVRTMILAFLSGLFSCRGLAW